MGIRRAQEIRVRITLQMDLLERDLYTGLVGDTKGEGANREGRAASGREEEEEEEAVARIYHNIVLSGKLQQAVFQATDR